MNSNNVLLQQDRAPSHTARNNINCRAKSHFYRACNVASKQSRLEPGRLCSVQQLVYCNGCLKLWNGWNRQSWMSGVRCMRQKFIDRSINEWRRRLKCVVQQNGRHIEHLFKPLFSRISLRYTRHFCFMQVCELYSFIDLLCNFHIYSHAVRCGAIYRSTVNRVKVVWDYLK